MMWTTTVCVLEEKEFPTDFVIIRGNIYSFLHGRKEEQQHRFCRFPKQLNIIMDGASEEQGKKGNEFFGHLYDFLRDEK